MLSPPNFLQFLDLRTILAVGALVAFAAAIAMAIQALKASTFRAPLWAATGGLLLGAISLMLGSISNGEPSSPIFLVARISGTFGFFGGMCALMLMFSRRFPLASASGVMLVSVLGFSIFSSGEALLNWSSFCQTLIAGVSGLTVFKSIDPLTPRLRSTIFFLCLLVAIGPLPHMYTSGVGYFDLNLPLFDTALAYRFRIVLNVTVLVLGYSCMNALTQARDSIRLRESVDYDMLTGAHSRRYLFDADEKILRRERNSNSHSTTVLLLDIDHFKQVNDQWGHQVGDQVLKHCVTQIREVIRSTDSVVARYGGEEFCIVVPQIDFKTATVLAERVRAQIQSKPFVDDKLNIAFTVSIGIAHRTQPKPLAELIHAADQFLYAAKRSGRNRVSYELSSL
jgi:diguanylate cyclase (GGDEF)-like protein